VRVIDLALKDLLQMVRDWKAAFFLLAMPILFTLLMGFLFSGTAAGGDPRLPVAFLDRDGGVLGTHLLSLLEGSDAVRPVVEEGGVEDVEKKVADGDVAGAVVVPPGYTEAVLAGDEVRLPVIADPGSAAATVQQAVQGAALRLLGAAQAGRLSAEAFEERGAFADEAERRDFIEETVGRAVEAWEQPPLTVEMRRSQDAVEEDSDTPLSYAHSSTGMMVQFAIAGLIGAAEVLVVERKSKALRRLLTTTISRWEIILGHYLAVFVLIFAQVAILIGFAQIVLGVDYLRAPLATLLVGTTMALWVAALGLLIGVVARTGEQVIIFAMVPMFVLSALGGAWMPLEETSETFQAIGHVLPSAWAMDGLKNIVMRDLGVSAALRPAAIMLAYAVALFAAAVWRFDVE